MNGHRGGYGTYESWSGEFGIIYWTSNFAFLAFEANEMLSFTDFATL
jgi:hypothetical protein